MARGEGWFFCVILVLWRGGVMTYASMLHEKQPVGFLMCCQLCQKVVGCLNFTYMTSHMYCLVGDLNQTLVGEKGKYSFRIKKELEYGTGNGSGKCPYHSFIFLSRAKKIQCLQFERESLEASNKKVNETWNMTGTVYENCQKLYEFCDQGDEDNALMYLTMFNKEARYLFQYFLFRHGCNLSLVDDGKNNILHMASEYGNTDLVKCILSKQGIKLDSRGPYGMTAIMIAAQNERRDVFTFLAKMGSNLKTRDVSGYTILHWAALDSDISILIYILQSGAVDINCRALDGYTPIMMAAANGKRLPLECLVRSGSNVSLVDKLGRNILHIACDKRRLTLVIYIVKNNMVDLRSKDSSGMTAIMIAVSRGFKLAFEVLDRRQQNLSGVDNSGNNILHLACKGGNEKIVNILLKRVSKTLLKNKNNKGKTPIDLVKTKRNMNIYYMLSSMMET